MFSGFGLQYYTEFDDQVYFFQVVRVDRPNTRSTKDLKRKADQIEQPPTKKASLVVLNGQANTKTKPTKRKKVQDDSKTVNNTHVLSKNNESQVKLLPKSTNMQLTPSKVKNSLSKVTMTKNKSKSATSASTSCTMEDKTHVSPRKKRTQNQVEDVLESILLENGNVDITEFPEPLQSTQELLSIMESQAVPDFDFKMPSSSLLEDIEKVFDGESNEESIDLNIVPNSTQDLRNVLMDSQDSSEDNLNANNIPVKNTPKKIFKDQTRSPSKKPKFDYSFDKFYNLGSSNNTERKRNSTSLKTAKKETPQKNNIGPSSSKSKNNKKSQKQKSGKRKEKSSMQSRVKTSDVRDISEIVSDVDDSQIMSQYSMTEDDMVEALYDDCIKVDTIHQDVEDEDIGWLKDLSQSYDDSCALVINEEPEDKQEDTPKQSTNSSFAFIKEAQHSITFDDEAGETEHQDEKITKRVEENDTSVDKSIQEVQDKIKTKYAGMTKTIEIIDPPVIKSETLRRSKRTSGSKRSSNSSNKPSTSTSRNSSITDTNRTGLSYYCRSVDESPKFMRTSLKQEARASHLRTTLKSEVKAKPAVRQVNFQCDAEQVQFDNEDTSCNVKNSERQVIKLNTKPSVVKLVSMESQSIKHTLSDMYRTNASVESELGDNVHLLCWICSWLNQQNTMEQPPPVYKGIHIDDHHKGKQIYSTIAEFYNTLEPLLYYQVWNDMFCQYARDRRPRVFTLHRDSVEYVPTSSIQSTRKKLFRLKCSIKNATSKWLSDKQILLLTFKPIRSESSPPFECFAYVNHIDKLSDNISFNLYITLSVVSEKELTIIPTSADINAHIMTKVDINHYKTLPRRYIKSHISSLFLNPDNVVEPPLLRMRDMLQNVGTCTLGQKHVVSTFLDVCLEKKRKLVIVDALAGTGNNFIIDAYEIQSRQM